MLQVPGITGNTLTVCPMEDKFVLPPYYPNMLLIRNLNIPQNYEYCPKMTIRDDRGKVLGRQRRNKKNFKYSENKIGQMLGVQKVT